MNPLLHRLGEILGDGNIFCYADDLLVLCDDDSMLHRAKNIIDNWADESHLQINYRKDKTAVLTVTHHVRKVPYLDLDIP